MVTEFLPLAFVVLLGFVVALSGVSKRLDRAVTQLSLGLFDEYVRRREQMNRRQRAWLEAAHIGTTYRVYASKTFFFATVSAVVGSIAGIYLIAAVASLVQHVTMPTGIPVSVRSFITSPGTLTLTEIFGILLFSSATLGVLSALLTYQFRWWMPQYMAGERERRIDNSIKRNVAFIFALSRSGMAFPKILAILSKNRGVYGETANEVAVTVKDIELFGSDVLTAIERLGERTPSEPLEELAENLSSVLQSGQSLSEFLRGEYEHFKNEEESQQQAFLELLSTLAEAYVTVFVAGPLFLITILVVIGLMLGGTLGFLRAMVYVIVPLSTVGFIVYLDTITEDVQNEYSTTDLSDDAGRFSDIRVVPDEDRTAVADGGVAIATNRARLQVYRRLRPWLRKFRHPTRLLTEQPVAILAVTVPLTLVFVLAQWWPHLTAGEMSIANYDDPFLQGLLFVIGTFAITFEVSNRRTKAIERAIPDFLDRLASTNEAGMSIVDSFGRVVRSDLGILTEELERTWADIVWGSRIEHALVRFQQRVETPAITRVVTLTTNAMSATNDIGQVLRIAADEAQATKRLERERRNEMLTYTVVVYLSFFVFLVIIVALDLIFVPAIPTGDFGASSGAIPGGGLGGGIQQLTESTKDAYSLLFFHAALIQAVASGFVAGQMGDGSVKAGAKHATVMLVIAYGLFILFA